MQSSTNSLSPGSKEVECEAEPVWGSCGITHFDNFELFEHAYKAYTVRNKKYKKGAGFALAGFVNDEACRMAYHIMAKRFKLMFQSPVRVNSNTGNRFFFCVYDTRKDKTNG